MKQYYVSDGAKKKGPFTIEQLKQGGVKPDYLVWCEGMDDWIRVSEMNELKSMFTPNTLPQNDLPKDNSSKSNIKQYYVSYGAKKKGPFTIEQLKQGGVKPDYLVWCEGMDDWKKISAVEELKDLVSAIPPLLPIEKQHTAPPAFLESEVPVRNSPAQTSGSIFLFENEKVLGKYAQGSIVLTTHRVLYKKSGLTHAQLSSLSLEKINSIENQYKSSVFLLVTGLICMLAGLFFLLQGLNLHRNEGILISIPFFIPIALFFLLRKNVVLITSGIARVELSMNGVQPMLIAQFISSVEKARNDKMK